MRRQCGITSAQELIQNCELWYCIALECVWMFEGYYDVYSGTGLVCRRSMASVTDGEISSTDGGISTHEARGIIPDLFD